MLPLWPGQAEYVQSSGSFHESQHQPNSLRQLNAAVVGVVPESVQLALHWLLGHRGCRRLSHRLSHPLSLKIWWKSSERMN